MAATVTVAQVAPLRKSSSPDLPPSGINSAPLRPRRGVLVLYGYGTSVRVERGHLVVEDGVGFDRYKGRFPRVGHGLERLVVIGADGVVSLAALRWLADQNASFVMLERNGNVLATTGPVRPSDVRLRRAQALAHHTGAAFRISRELIDRKLAGQERVASQSLKDQTIATQIKQIRSELAEVETLDGVRSVELRAAKIYWKAWRAVPVKFPEKDLPRAPEHWQKFGSRASTLSGSSRLAVNPVNAILNYLYALLEAECRLAIAALGLDPEMGVLHMDTINRDSLACDLMEAIRPEVDAYVLNQILKQPLKRNWFFEERSGNCRLMADLASQLAETTSTWARLVAPLAEWTVKEIASTTKSRRATPATRLTQNHKREMRGGSPFVASKSSVTLQNVCSDCGSPIINGNEKCRVCSVEESKERLTRVATEGRVVSHSSKAQAKRSETQIARQANIRKWSISDQPCWLTAEFYVEKIQPQIAFLSSSLIKRELGVSRGYSAEIRHGRVPHPRHWWTLAKLLALSEQEHMSQISYGERNESLLLRTGLLQHRLPEETVLKGKQSKRDYLHRFETFHRLQGADERQQQNRRDAERLGKIEP
jgi:CRISPR-associated endonuclease Cas1